MFISARIKALQQIRTLSCTLCNASKHDLTILGKRKAELL